MFPVTGAFWGFLSGLLVALLADLVMAFLSTPEDVWAACVEEDTSGSIIPLRCRALAWRYAWRRTRQVWRGPAWWRGRLWVLAALFAALGYNLAQSPKGWGFAPLLLSAAYFALVAIVDAETHFIPYEEAMLGLLLGVGVGLPRHGLLNTLGGILGGALIMGALYWLGARYGRWQAHRRGTSPPADTALGFGDVYLSGVLGAFLGWPGVLASLILGTLLMGGFILLLGLVTLVRQRTLRGLGSRFLPMGPFLVLAAFWLMVTV